MTLTVQTELRDDAKGNDLEAKEWGLTARRLSVIEAKELTRKDQKGVLINSVRPGGPAEQAQPGLMARDVITDIGGKPVNDLDSFVKITAEMTREKTEPVPVLVAFDRKGERELTIVDVGIVKPQEPPAELEKAWLPVATQVLSRKLAEALNLTGVMGVRITQVYPGSTAEEADFRVGDVITHVDGRPIQASESHNAHVFESMLRAYKPGAKPEFDVIRDGQKIKITSTLVVVPKTENQLKVYEDSMLEFKARDIAYLDALKRRWKKDEKGVLVTETDPGGWASVGGLFPDDLILAVDGHAVLNVDDLEQTLEAVQQKKPKQINFLVRRGIHTLFVELEPKWPGKK